MDISEFKNELDSANIEYACDSAYVIVMNTKVDGLGVDFLSVTMEPSIVGILS